MFLSVFNVFSSDYSSHMPLQCEVSIFLNFMKVEDVKQMFWCQEYLKQDPKLNTKVVKTLVWVQHACKERIVRKLKFMVIGFLDKLIFKVLKAIYFLSCNPYNSFQSFWISTITVKRTSSSLCVPWPKLLCFSGEVLSVQ